MIPTDRDSSQAFYGATGMLLQAISRRRKLGFWSASECWAGRNLGACGRSATALAVGTGLFCHGSTILQSSESSPKTHGFNGYGLLVLQQEGLRKVTSRDNAQVICTSAPNSNWTRGTRKGIHSAQNSERAQVWLPRRVERGQRKNRKGFTQPKIHERATGVAPSQKL